MEAHAFLKEIKKYPVVRSQTWQGRSARGGPQYEYTKQQQQDGAMDVEMKNETLTSPSPSPLWTRLSNASGSATHGSAIVRLMQKHVLENVENLPLDQIELLARRC